MTMETLVLEGTSLVNSGSARDFAASNREPQKVQGNGRISRDHFIPYSASPAISPTALAKKPYLQQSDSSGTQWLWE